MLLVLARRGPNERREFDLGIASRDFGHAIGADSIRPPLGSALRDHSGLVALLFVREQWGQFVKLLFAAALLAALSLAGHAGASIAEGRLIHLVNDAFHLIAAGAWPAGLAPFALFLAQALQADQPDEMQIAASVTRRFSFLSLVTVGTLAITGAVNGYFLVGTLHALVATVYGRLLLLKIALFAAMVVIGAFNLLWLKPQILVAAKSTALGESSKLLRSLRRNVLSELFLGTIVIIVVGVLGITPPAADFEMPTDVSSPHDSSRTSAAQRLKVLSPALRSSLGPTPNATTKQKNGSHVHTTQNHQNSNPQQRRALNQTARNWQGSPECISAISDNENREKATTT